MRYDKHRCWARLVPSRIVKFEGSLSLKLLAVVE